MQPSRLRLPAATLLAVAALAGCGGDDPSPASTQGSTTTSSAAGTSPGSTPTVSAPAAPGGQVVRGTGYEIRTPEGFRAGARTPGDPLDLTLIAEVTGGFPTNISVSRTPAPAGASVEDVRGSIRQQSEASGGTGLQALDDREIDGEPAIGLSYSRKAQGAPGDPEIVQRVYAVIRGRGFYTIAVSAEAGRAPQVESALKTLLDTWSWTS